MLENQRPHRSCVNCTHFFLQQMKIFVGFFCVAFLKNLQFIFAIASLCAILFTFEVVAYRSTHIFGSALLVPNYYCCGWWWCYCASSFKLFSARCRIYKQSLFEIVSLSPLTMCLRECAVGSVDAAAAVAVAATFNLDAVWYCI